MTTVDQVKRAAAQRREMAQGGLASESLTVRDYFAAKAMQSLLICSVAPNSDAAQVIAEAGGVGPYAYTIANTMLKAREA